MSFVFIIKVAEFLVSVQLSGIQVNGKGTESAGEIYLFRENIFANNAGEIETGGWPQVYMQKATKPLDKGRTCTIMNRRLL